ncbi:MAG TPA: hypothetical protein VKR32_05370 [Puia sp.]|nr:hypothetical protein [Puia sp.]
MQRFKILCLGSLVLTFITASCSKDLNGNENKSGIQNTPTTNPQSFIFSNVTIDSYASRTFAVPAITEAVIDRGAITVYESGMELSSQSWQVLPVIVNCQQRLEVTNLGVGTVEIQNTLGLPVTCSYRFDIMSN